MKKYEKPAIELEPMGYGYDILTVSGDKGMNWDSTWDEFNDFE